MVANPFSKSPKATDSDSSDGVVDKTPAALSAFLSPASRFVQSNKKDSASTKQLSPDDIALKVASMLKPGPPFYSTVSSADLIDNLGSASIMNCVDLRSKAEAAMQAQSAQLTTNGASMTSSSASAPWLGVGTVWNALNGMPSGKAAFAIPGESGTTASVQATDDSNQDDGLWSSIMVSCDTKGENLALERSVVIPTHVLRTHHYYQGNSKALFTDIGAGSTYKWDNFADYKKGDDAAKSMASYFALPSYSTIDMWSWPSWVPFLGDKDKDDGNATKPADGATTPSKDGDTDKDTDTNGKKRVWVASTTKISCHATWWGYTLYLPEAVFAELESDVNQAEKIANIIHTVLTTILDKISSLPIPLALQAVITVLKAIAPSTAYISTFIGWSWNQIKSFDKGQGVELSATWILPIALIPHTWDAPTAPADTNGDGTPDGAPVAAPQQPSVPAAGAPAATPAPATPAKPTTSAPSQPTTSDPSAPATPAQPTAPSTTPATETPEVNDDKTEPAVSAPKDDDAVKQPAATTPTPATPATPATPKPETPAPGATLPPADSNTSDGIDWSNNPTYAPGQEPQGGDVLGRGNPDTTAPPSMGDDPAPTPPANNDGDDSTTTPAATTKEASTAAAVPAKKKQNHHNFFGKTSKAAH